MNIRRIMYRLQMVLNMRGMKIKINQRQVWSERQERMVNKYVVLMEKYDKKKQRMRFETVLESYQAADVAKYLAGLLENGGGGA